MKIYMVRYRIRIGWSCEYFEEFNEAFAYYLKMIQIHDTDSCWNKDAYKDTQIYEYSETDEEYVPVR